MIVVGIVIAGAWSALWFRRRSKSANESERERAREYESFADVVLISLQSGAPVVDTLRIAAECSHATIQARLMAMVDRVERGEHLNLVLQELSDVFGPRSFPLVDILRSSLSDGMPVMHIIERLADEARAERRRQLNEELRRLPVRLVFPLTFCVLPSFVLLTIVPVGFHALSSLSQGATP